MESAGSPNDDNDCDLKLHCKSDGPGGTAGATFPTAANATTTHNNDTLPRFGEL